jgi:hypothetical protein
VIIDFNFWLWVVSCELRVAGYWFGAFQVINNKGYALPLAGIARNRSLDLSLTRQFYFTAGVVYGIVGHHAFNIAVAGILSQLVFEG